MALQKKYYYTFKDTSNVQYTAEIWQDTASAITAEEIRGDYKPFSIEYPQTGLFEPVKGSGCELNLLSTTDRKFFNLYTADMMEYQIRFYKAGVLIWCGYLDSELYSEPFSESENYPVTFTGTDGFALLERMNYLTSDGSKYTGLVLQWDIIKNILNKLILPYKNIFVGLSTTSNDFTLAAGETLFHKTYSNNQNWYNEDGEAETCRVVLENILKSYGAYIIQDNANIYIVDINNIAGATNTPFKKYDSSFNYISTDNINLNIGDLTTIGFTASDSTMNVVSGFNRQVVRYSPYITPVILDFNAEEDFSNELPNPITYGVLPYRYTEKKYNDSNTWLKYNTGSFASYIGLDQSNEGTTEHYLKIVQPRQQTLLFKCNKTLPIFIPSNSRLKITASMFVSTTDNLESFGHIDKAYLGRLKCKLKIGDKHYKYQNTFEYDNGYNYIISEGWEDNTVDSYLVLDFEKPSIQVDGGSYYPRRTDIGDTWTNLKSSKVLGTGKTMEVISKDFTIPLNEGFAGGEMTFEINDWTVWNYIDFTGVEIEDIRLKDIKFTVVDENGKEFSDDDIEYIGFMNSKFKNEGNEINVYQGTSKIKSPIERAALMGFNTNYYYLSTWSREGKTDCLENLLLRSIVSNYTNKRVELTATINQLNSVLGCVKYQNFLPNKNLMVTGVIQDFSNAATSVTLQEVIKDNLEINKSW